MWPLTAADCLSAQRVSISSLTLKKLIDLYYLTHCGLPSEILAVIDLDNALSAVGCGAITWTNYNILSIGFGDNTDLLWWHNVNNQFCQLTTRVS